jgi:tRNA threonylcarbamoyladenosine biosynthesis protein TsaE
MNRELKFDAADENATAALGTALAEALLADTLTPALSPGEREIKCGGAVIGLIGPLGAGKTRLVQAVARGAGVEEGIVASPTFVLIHEYAGRVPIYHFDAYRLRSEVEFAALGPEEYFSRPGWSFIEWADRVASCLPSDRLEIAIQLIDPSARRLTFAALGPRHERLLAELSRRFIFY